MKVNIGGERLGSGNKMNTELRNYSRSTHDLSEKWTSSMAPGVLYPFLVKPVLNGDTFEINLNAGALTIPTQGPLFSSYKYQLDIFSVPMRLYQGILHNNPINIGMQMNQVYMPKMRIYHNENGDTSNDCQFSTSCLWKYLGLSGIGTTASHESRTIFRDINAIPLLAYYDIFKCYYANKQEEKAYVISTSLYNTDTIDTILEIGGISDNGFYQKICGNEDLPYSITNINGYKSIKVHTTTSVNKEDWIINDAPVYEYETFDIEVQKIQDNLYVTTISPKVGTFGNGTYVLKARQKQTYSNKIDLQTFPLTNIDAMRKYLLSQTNIGEEIILDCTDEENPGSLVPYMVNGTKDPDNGISWNKGTMNGLCLKTYQSDLFNSFVQTEWIDGDNGIAALTAVDVSSGKLVMDALNLQQKLYNMLNRVAVSGGTFEDWQEAVWTQKAVRKAETPIYCGGLSKEIVFEEVVSSAETKNADGTINALGTLGGRGRVNAKHKGGHIIIKVNEPSFIMGIVSITPRIAYSQGNEWYLTELSTFDDLHKPALDGIGFEDLIGERMAWWDTRINQLDPSSPVIRNSYGKVPAWINYMTSFDKVFGDFANQSGKSYMVLSRGYERKDLSSGGSIIKDATTYIDPSKYNYAFAYNLLDAQNFWAQIYTQITARRLMSAKIIPNL